MSKDSVQTRLIWMAGVFAVIAFSAYAITLTAMNWPLSRLSLEDAANFAESFGVLNALFTAGAFLLLLWTLAIQRQELRLQREEMARTVATQQRSLHMELLKYSIDDPELAKVWGLPRDTNLVEFRQHMYINLILSQWEMNLKQGMMNERETMLTLDMYMKRSQYFRKFWERAAQSRKIDLETGTEEEIKFHELAERAYKSALADTSTSLTNHQDSVV